MTRTRQLSLAAACGITVAAGLAVAARGDDPGRAASRSAPATSPAGALAPQIPSPPIDERPAFSTGRPMRPGSPQLVAKVADPAGGAPWVLRTFQRGGAAGRATWCAQLGRLVDGRFVWIAPGGRVARPIRERENDTTVCALPGGRAPGLAVDAAGMPDRAPSSPQARVGAVVTWGVADATRGAAQLTQNGKVEPVQIERHGVLRVLPGSEPAVAARLAVAGHRPATSSGWFDIETALSLNRQMLVMMVDDSERALRTGTDDDAATRQAIRRNIARARQALSRDFDTPAALARAAVSAPRDVTQVATLGSSRWGVPQALFAHAASADSKACVSTPFAALDGRPVEPRRSGLVVETPLDCRVLPKGADGAPTPLGSSWEQASTRDVYNPALVGDAVRRVQRRIPNGNGGILVGTPPGTALLEVQSPVGVKTVRVSPARVTWVSWEGAPQVQRALFGQRRVGRNVTFRALDAAGRQIGRDGYAWPPREAERGR